MHPIRLLRPAAVGVIVLLAGCATSDSHPPDDQDARQFDVLRQSDFKALRNHSALEAIRQLRPRWLHGRGHTPGVDATGREARVVRGVERVKAYVDGIRQDVDLLDLLPLEQVAVMEFLGASAATVRYGVGHEAGAILVITRN